MTTPPSSRRFELAHVLRDKACPIRPTSPKFVSAFLKMDDERAGLITSAC